MHLCPLPNPPPINGGGNGGGATKGNFMELKDKISLITGSGLGIGKAIALEFAKVGSDIIVSDVLEDAGQGTCEEIKKLGRQSIFFKTDVSNSEDVKNTVDKAIEIFGRIDILVNNAGITKDQLIMKMSEEEWDKVIAVNLKGTFNFCKAVSRYMLKQRSGKIINIASIVGQIGNIGQVNYAASKAGVIGITKTLAKEFASRNINVNAIAPGFIKTRMTDALSDKAKEELTKMIPLNRLGEPLDVAKVALFLASDYSNYITGQVIRVDGGMVIS